MSRRDDPNRALQLRRWDYRRRGGVERIAHDGPDQLAAARKAAARGSSYAKAVVDDRTRTGRNPSKAQARAIRQIETEQRINRRRRRV